MAKQERKTRMAGRLDGKVAIITGGAGDIGLETARVFVAEGAFFAFVDLDELTVKRAASSLSADDRTVGITADVTDETDVSCYVAATLAQFGTIDILFNNAGIESPVAPVTNVESCMRSDLAA
jgi:3alpha(or 20beta)-hydroxysteroid dehydrogenase